MKYMIDYPVDFEPSHVWQTFLDRLLTLDLSDPDVAQAVSKAKHVLAGKDG